MTGTTAISCHSSAQLSDIGGIAVTDAMHAEPAREAPSQIASPPAGAPEELRWRELVNALPTAIYMTDTAGRITFYNEAAAALWGTEPEIGKSEWCGSWKLYHPDGTPLPHDECPMAVTLKTGQPVRGVEAVAERPDGTRVPFMPYPTPLHDASGRLIGAVNMLLDLTETQARRARRAAPRRDRRIFRRRHHQQGPQRHHHQLECIGASGCSVTGPRRWSAKSDHRSSCRPTATTRSPAYCSASGAASASTTTRPSGAARTAACSTFRSPFRQSGMPTGRIVGASKIARDITDRKQAEARQRLLTRELHHRTKNLFAVVQAVVSRSFAGKATVEEAQTAVMDRLHSLGQAHILLVDRQWHGTDLRELVSGEMRPFSERVTVSGPALIMNPQAAQSFALAVHELATNAAKYGALSSPSGRVVIGWSVDQSDGGGEFAFHWQEHDGPAVAQPLRKGFGSTVLEQVMAEYATTPPHLEFARGGVVYDVKGPLAAIAAATPEPRPLAAFGG